MNFHYRMAQNLTAKFVKKDPGNISIIQLILATSNQLFHLTIINFNYDARRKTRHLSGKKIGLEDVKPVQVQLENDVLYLTGKAAI